MTTVNFVRHAAAAAASSLLLAAAPAFAVAAPPAPFNALYAFGDSLSDSGSLFAITGGGFPAAPYFNGRFSNGPVAVEYLAAGLLGANSPNFHDMAIGGARTGLSGSADPQLGGFTTGMTSQFNRYKASLGPGGQADSGALYYVMGGANDMRDAFAANDVAAGMSAAIGNLKAIVTGLHDLGATNFFLPNLPDLGLTPEARAVPDVIPGVLTFSALASQVSVNFNQQLMAAYEDLRSQWTDEHFHYFDVMVVQRAITFGSPGNGFTNVTSPCVGTASCGTSMYFDTIHPTAAVHQILGNGMLAAVPEPQTMLLMAVGLLGLLGASRRRQV